MKLKAILLLVLCAFFVAGDLNAEELKKKRRKKKKRKGKIVAFKAGQMDVAVGGGFSVKENYSKTDYSIYGTNDIKGGFPFGIRAEFGVNEFLGIGVAFGMYKDQVTITDVTVPENIYGYKHKYTTFSVRPAFHIPLGMPKLDPYAAVSLGGNIVKATPTGTGYNYVQQPMKSGLAWAIHGGANYYFSSNIGAFVEAGYGQAIPMFGFGVVAKF
jgi:hypothetical protein